ncbi:CaiB/BaiF CoA-transferase family protein [Mycobacterium sp. CVI_P3]|uniref:CaiB/BaiF CoA-transferase family protein n=1 Tax=Mycobacterium pinniadriaticum TaxID=2994102 RepID=A0ABT3SNQ1_9MYCO|nr:CaiB/BaiF CoA-transferase family protein [Mycobacterium pinniadriaticum]MCX2934742.1 CaiB/BaiF CoA-transferase family protein [Mycobacterium pinniadriaticum]MCX2941164.1 CaiB/BaiF CoA-transferase family protein [Mycobacterium pinniadriaticum]
MGPLEGVRIIEMAGLGAVPFAGMLLSDMGAEVIRIDRLAQPQPGSDGYESQWRSADPHAYVMNRGRRSVAVDLRIDAGKELVLDLAARADVLIEGFRPGVMERLGLGPDVCGQRNLRLVYARLTGWGQQGPLAQTAGHDLTYLAVTGLLRTLARPGERPVTPTGLLADLAGGGLMAAFGVVCALHEVNRSGQGQVVDAAMVDGVASLTAMLHSLMAQGRWRDEPGVNFADGGAPFYDVYEAADGGYVVLAALETKFYDEFLERAGLDAGQIPSRDDTEQWPALRKILADVFRKRTRAEWQAVFDDTDACVAPVLSLTEALQHRHLSARETFTTRWGLAQPAPCPRFSRSQPELNRPPAIPGADSRSVLIDWAIDPSVVDHLQQLGVVSPQNEC